MDDILAWLGLGIVGGIVAFLIVGMVANA